MSIDQTALLFFVVFLLIIGIPTYIVYVNHMKLVENMFMRYQVRSDDGWDKIFKV